MKIFRNTFIIISMILIFFSCKKDSTEQKEDSGYIFTAPISNEKLPEDLVWLTNESDPEFASTDAKKGGTLHYFLDSFPNTFRIVGPDSNHSTRGYILDNQYDLISFQPNTLNIIPCIATHWAFGKDNKTMYFKLNKNVKWSDGKQVTAHDFAYTIEFMRSKHIVAPWYNDYYTNFIERVEVFDDYTLSVVATKPLPDIYLYLGISPTPRHYYGNLDKDFVNKYNWTIVPNTGPYQIKSFSKGKNIIFERKKNWWADDLKYYRNRFNVDKVIFTVNKNEELQWEYFKKGKIDVFPLIDPDYWHKKSDIDIFNNGYVIKLLFFTDTQQPARGLFLNQDKEIFKDINLRYAFAYAMNIEMVIEKVLWNDYYRLDHDFVGYGKYSNNSIKARKYDIKKVEQYMKLSDWKRGNDGIWEKEGKRFSVEVTYTLDSDEKQLIILKEEALKSGIELKLDKLDYASRYKKIMEKKHEVSLGAWSTNLIPEYWQSYHSDNAHKPQTNNITNTDDPELDKSIEKYRFSIDRNERIQLSMIIQKKLYNLCAFVPTYMRPFTRNAHWRWWKLPSVPGTKNSVINYDLSEDLFDPFDSSVGGLFWYDEQLHKETLDAMKKGIKFDPVTIIDKTYMMEILKEDNKK